MVEKLVRERLELGGPVLRYLRHSLVIALEPSLLERGGPHFSGRVQETLSIGRVWGVHPPSTCAGAFSPPPMGHACSRYLRLDDESSERNQSADPYINIELERSVAQGFHNRAEEHIQVVEEYPPSAQENVGKSHTLLDQQQQQSCTEPVLRKNCLEDVRRFIHFSGAPKKDENVDEETIQELLEMDVKDVVKDEMMNMSHALEKCGIPGRLLAKICKTQASCLEQKGPEHCSLQANMYGMYGQIDNPDFITFDSRITEIYRRVERRMLSTSEMNMGAPVSTQESRIIDAVHRVRNQTRDRINRILGLSISMDEWRRNKVNRALF